MSKMIHKTKRSLSLVLAMILWINHVGGVFAAPALQGGTPIEGDVQRITLEADTVTGVTLVSVEIVHADQSVQNLRVSLESAIALGLVTLNGDGKPEINNQALGKPVDIEPSIVLPDEAEHQHPIGSALATFFSELDGIDYETIMTAHEQGVGFGLIAQMLWLTTKLEGTSEIFEELVHAHQTGDFSAFVLEDGSTPGNWGQLRKAILETGKKNSLGVVISKPENNGNGNESNNGNGNNGNNNSGKEKEKEKEKEKGNGQEKEKEKEKEKKK
jgi:hypothetical protein